jgi:long-chain fatty acid transport protein
MHKKLLMRALPAAILGLTAGSSFAAGFALIEQGASGLGNSFAGAAAVAEDASTIFFNPAGMTKLPEGKQVVVALHAIDPSAKFNNGASASANGLQNLIPGTPPTVVPSSFTSGGYGGDAGNLAFVPNAYFSMVINPNLRFGLGINAPYGMKTEYDDNWIGRFQTIKAEVKTININPSIAFKFNDRVSLGFGLDYQRMDATLTKAINYNAVVAATNPFAAIAIGNVEGSNEIKGSDSAWGFNLGAVFDLTDSTRLGLAYRSEIKYHLTGTHTATHPTTVSAAANTIISTTNLATLNQDVSLDIKMPDTLSASVVQHLNDRWDMLGDLSWTGWSKIQELRIKYATGAADEVTTWKLRDTYRVSFGGTFRYNDTTKIRFGLAYDQSPVTDQYRTARLPDNNRTWVSVGAQYALTKSSTFDWGYAHLFVKDAYINSTGDLSRSSFGYARGVLNGNYNSSIDILSVQYTASF